jgi:hypothetical protein
VPPKPPDLVGATKGVVEVLDAIFVQFEGQEGLGEALAVASFGDVAEGVLDAGYALLVRRVVIHLGIDGRWQTYCSAR